MIILKIMAIVNYEINIKIQTCFWTWPHEYKDQYYRAACEILCDDYIY